MMVMEVMASAVRGGGKTADLYDKITHFFTTPASRYITPTDTH